jgi:uncharacterized protein YegJ (DUF2314 family)
MGALMHMLPYKWRSMMKVFVWLKIPFLLCLFLLASCSSSSSLEGTPVTDEELDAAIQQAHATLNVLREALIAPKDSYDFVGLKVRFRTDGGLIDDNWTQPVAYYEGVFTIRMMDGLTYEPNQHTDHLLNVPLGEVVDWVIVEKDGNLIGGYTIRLDYEHMTSEEKEEFLKNTGYKIE